MWDAGFELILNKPWDVGYISCLCLLNAKPKVELRPKKTPKIESVSIKTVFQHRQMKQEKLNSIS